MVFNPGAGKKSALRYRKQIEKGLQSFYSSVIIHDTENQDDTKLFIDKRLNEGIEMFVAVGGDGTVNTVGSQLMQSGAIMGIIPLGSGNGLARHLGIPLNINKAIKLLGDSGIKKIDCGFMNDIPFFCTAGVGFDAKVAHEFSRKKNRGTQVYLEVLLQEYWKFRPQEYEIQFEKQTIKITSFLVTFANAAQWGANAYISPDAEINDGLLDMCLISEFPQIFGPLLGFQVLTRIINISNNYEMVRIKEAGIKRKTPGWAHYDGEPVFLPEKLVFRVVPGALNVCVEQ